MSPQIAIILVGTNNVSAGNSPAQIVQGISDLVETIAASTTFVVKLLPRWDLHASQIARVNDALTKWSWLESVRVIESGVAAEEKNYFDIHKDKVHLSSTGYRCLADAIVSSLSAKPLPPSKPPPPPPTPSSE